jgi:hypothetical protein
MRPGDPEDSTESPFQDLGLLTHYRHTGQYEVRRDAKNIPPELFAYCLAQTFGTITQGCTLQGSYLTVPLQEAVAMPGAPARIFSLTPESLVDTVQEAEAFLGEDCMSLMALGGERGIRLRNVPSLQWVARYYARASMT